MQLEWHELVPVLQWHPTQVALLPTSAFYCPEIGRGSECSKLKYFRRYIHGSTTFHTADKVGQQTLACFLTQPN